jgi:hypothetical protein
MASKLDMPLADVIKLNKKNPGEKGEKGQKKGFNKNKEGGGRKFKRPVRASEGGNRGNKVLSNL